MLTIAYITNRLNPRIEWFLDSLHLQSAGDYKGIKVVIVDYHAEAEGRCDYITERARCPVVHVPPKPTVWQGKYRLTKQNYFAASNARNTALCYAEDGQIAYVDDLSVLMPGWLGAVKHAEKSKLIVFGVYEKVQKLLIHKGLVMSYDETHGMTGSGKDVRLKVLQEKGITGAVACDANWLFGCSLTLPVEALLATNGWDEDCDSMGYEDVFCGLMLKANGFQCYIDTNMKTLEDDLAHFEDESLKRIDKPNVHGHKDASHAMVHMARNGRNRAPNYFGDDGILGMRKRILAGESFPPSPIPEHDWRDGQSIKEM